jgi:hypothetical protein
MKRAVTLQVSAAAEMRQRVREHTADNASGFRVRLSARCLA